MTTPNYETPAERTAIQTINYTIDLSSLGLVLVAGTPKGICAILLGSKEHSLVGQLRSIFPKATPHKDGKELDELLSRVIQLIETPNVRQACPWTFTERISKSEYGKRSERFLRVKPSLTRKSPQGWVVQPKKSVRLAPPMLLRSQYPATALSVRTVELQVTAGE